jgi:phosphoribosylanthranilate isomerase
MPAPIVKICCICSLEEAQLSIRAGARVLGLVSQMPSDPGLIEEPLIASIPKVTPRHIRTFLLTAHTDAVSIAAQHNRCGTTSLQLVDHLPHIELMQSRRMLPAVELIQVIHVSDRNTLDDAVAVAPLVDAILLDSGDLSLAVKELGGTGRTHDWSVSRRIRDAVDKPVFLAGGLNAANLSDAVAAVQPFGLDVCSGLRTDGLLDADKVQVFMRTSRNRRERAKFVPTGLANTGHVPSVRRAPQARNSPTQQVYRSSLMSKPQ